MKMQNYEFKSHNGEFVIYNPETGRNWDNQLFNELGYKMTVSHTGMVYSNYVDENGINCELNRCESNCLYIKYRTYHRVCKNTWRENGIARICFE